MSTARKRTLLMLVVILVALITPAISLASSITIRPLLIDETLVPRDTYTETIKLTSDYPIRKAVLYATVNEITLNAAGDITEFVSPVMTDRTNTVTSWIEISRARIEVPAAETVEVPVTVRVHPQAVPGEYTVFIGFVEAPNRPRAEEIALAGEARGVLLKVIVADQREDSMNIVRFGIDRFVTDASGREITIDVENTGDLPSTPAGEIVFYNSRGMEISSVAVSGPLIAPGETGTLRSQVPLEGKVGRFKANISLRYGDEQQALFDTTYFYLMPRGIMFAIIGALILLVVTIIFFIRRTFTPYEDDDYQEVTLYVRDGHDAQSKDHDIDLKRN